MTATASELATLAFQALCDEKPAAECDELAAEAARAYRQENGQDEDDRYLHLRN